MRTICTIKGHQLVSLFDGWDVVVDLVVGGGNTVVPFLSEIETLEKIRYIENCKMLSYSFEYWLNIGQDIFSNSIVSSYHFINLHVLSKDIWMYNLVSCWDIHSPIGEAGFHRW